MLLILYLCILKLIIYLILKYGDVYKTLSVYFRNKNVFNHCLKNLHSNTLSNRSFFGKIVTSSFYFNKYIPVYSNVIDSIRCLLYNIFTCSDRTFFSDELI